MMMFGLVRVWKQIEADINRGRERNPEEDYLIRGEPNELFRWCITIVIAIVVMLRIIYFDQGYCLITLIVALLHLDHLIAHLFSRQLCLDAASDWAITPYWAPDGRLIQLEPLISTLFANKLSPRDFASFVNRIMDFKFWFMTTTMLLLAFLLTWLPFLKCSWLGPKKAFFLWFLMGLFTFATNKLYDPYSHRYVK